MNYYLNLGKIFQYILYFLLKLLTLILFYLQYCDMLHAIKSLYSEKTITAAISLFPFPLPSAVFIFMNFYDKYYICFGQFGILHLRRNYFRYVWIILESSIQFLEGLDCWWIIGRSQASYQHDIQWKSQCCKYESLDFYLYFIQTIIYSLLFIRNTPVRNAFKLSTISVLLQYTLSYPTCSFPHLIFSILTHRKKLERRQTPSKLILLKWHLLENAAMALQNARTVKQYQFNNLTASTQDRKNPITSNQKGQFLWSCRFCKQQNRSRELFFVTNGYKFAIQKNLKSKIVPPILLFVIDNSGSMSQSIFSNMQYGSNPQKIAEAKKKFPNKFHEIIMQSKLYEAEKKERQKIQQSYTQLVKNAKYTEEQVSKLTFLYAMIEYNLKNLQKKKVKKDFRIGFIFFSDMIYVLKAAKQKQIPVYIQNGQLCHEQWPYKKQVVNFYQYQSLFSKGRQYDKYFGDSRIKSMDLSKISINKVKGGGRTALGPALALAMGIISMHDQGSRIFLVTDSLPNFGILTTEDSQYIYNKIGHCLQSNGATLNILKWTGEQAQKSHQQQSWMIFCGRFRAHIQQIQLNLSRCKQGQGIQMSMNALNALFYRQPVGLECQVSMLCDSPRVTPIKLAYDFKDYKTLRFLSNSSKCWVTLVVDQDKVQPYDFLFPVTTQIVIRYSDVFTKERYIFMSYTKHHLFQASLMKNLKKDKSNSQTCLEQQQTINYDNINEVLNLQILNKYQCYRHEDLDQDDDRRTVFRYKTIELQREFPSINDIASIKNLQHQDSSFSSFENYESL